MTFYRSQLFVVFLVLVTGLKAQTYTSTNYYYNNFNGGVLGSSLSQIGATASWEVTPTSSVNNLSSNAGYSLRSKGNAKAGGLALAALPTGTNLDSQIYGHEWTMLFKSNVNAANSDVIDDNENSWKYWLFAENSNLSTARGYFLTQEGTTIYLRWKYNNSTSTNQYNTLLSFNLNSLGGNGKTYAIRVQRLRRQGQATWNLYIDEYTPTKKEASTKRGNTAYESSYGTYNYSALLCSSTAAGNFTFDDLKVYAIQLNISGANDIANGISNPLTPGQVNAPIYGLQVQIRGLLDVYQLRFSLAGNITSILDANTVKLYRSTDSYYGNADDVFVVNMDCYDSAIQKYGGLSETFYSTGADDGSLVTYAYYYIGANVRSNPNANATFTFTGAPEIIGESSQNNYSNSGSVTNVVSQPAVSGKTYNWTPVLYPINPDWNTANNWTPNGVPGPNDVAIIGSSTTYYHDPVVNDNLTVGNIIFGSRREYTLTIKSGKTLTVKSNINNQNTTTIAGAGTLDIKGSWISVPSGTSAINVTSSITNLTIGNLLLNPTTAATAFDVTSGTLTLSSGYHTLSTARVSTFDTNNARVVFKGPNPFSLASGTISNNVLDFAAGAVEYGANVNQNVYGSSVPNYSGSMIYKDLFFTGNGQKIFQAGNVNVTGNWSSSGGKLDLTTNNATVSFSGATQAITDQGSDGGLGVVFKNINISGGSAKTLSTTGKFAVAPAGTLTMSGSTILQTSNNLTLKSDATGTAQVAAIPTAASIRGKVIAERFVQGGNQGQYRTYRMLSSPVYDAPATFQTSGIRTYKVGQLIDDIIITGAGGTANGFDASANNNATVFTYGSTFVPVTSTSQNINVGTGLYLFYRGDRSNASAKTQQPVGGWPNPENTTVTFDGILTQQNVVVPLASLGYSLVGNPYAATIDWNSAGVTKTGIENKIWVWNPHIKQYAVLAGGQSTNSASNLIPSGQSFFVKSIRASASVTFSEQAKTAIQQSIGTNLLMSEPSSDQLRLNKTMSVSNAAVNVKDPVIKMKMSNPATFNRDEAVLVLKSGGDAALTEEDAADMDGEGVFLSTYSSDNKRLAINYTEGIENFSKVDLYTSASTTGDYELSFEIADLPNSYELYLIDNYTKTNKTIINRQSISFSINRADATSFAQGRFQLAVKPAATLPVQLLSFTATKNKDAVELNWKAIADSKHDHFYMKKTDGIRSEVISSGISERATGDFNLLDKKPFVGNNYYTLIQVDKDGKETTYGPVVVKFDLSQQTGLIVYPNPVVESCTIQYETTESNLVLEINDILGNKKYQQKISKEDLATGQTINIANLASAIYFATIKNAQGKILASSRIIKK